MIRTESASAPRSTSSPAATPKEADGRREGASAGHTFRALLRRVDARDVEGYERLEGGARRGVGARGGRGRGDVPAPDDEAALAPFRAPPAILLCPEPASRVEPANAIGLDAARAIAERIVEASRIESVGPAKVELVMSTRADVLGGVEIRVRFEGGQIHAAFATTQPEARAALEAQLGALREVLVGKGLSVGEIVVAEPSAPRHGRDGERERRRGARDDGREGAPERESR